MYIKVWTIETAFLGHTISWISSSKKKIFSNADNFVDLIKVVKDYY